MARMKQTGRLKQTAFTSDEVRGGEAPFDERDVASALSAASASRPPPRSLFPEQLALLGTATQIPLSAGTALFSPTHTAFFRILDAFPNCRGVHAAWERATLRYAGAPSDSREECIHRIDDTLTRLVTEKKRATDMFVHDALNAAARLLRLARWGLRHPGKKSTFQHTFPRSRHRFKVVDAAASFAFKVDTREQYDLLRSELGMPSKIAPVPASRALPHVRVLQTKEAFFLVHARRTVRYEKLSLALPGGWTQADLLSALDASMYEPIK
jgi:hypothetical protein